MRGIAMTIGVTRKRRVADGEGMLTVVAETVVTYADGTTELLIPGRARFDPSHPLVRQAPEKFTLCDRRDRTTAPAHFRAMLARAEREVKREIDGDPASRTAPRRTSGHAQLPQRKPRRAWNPDRPFAPGWEIRGSARGVSARVGRGARGCYTARTGDRESLNQAARLRVVVGR